VTTRVATWSATHPLAAIVTWLLVVVATLSLGALIQPTQATQLELGVGQSGRADTIASSAGFVDAPTENVLLTARAGGAFDRAGARAAARQVAAELKTLPVVDEVGPVTRSADGQAVVVMARLHGTADADASRLAPIKQVVAKAQAEHPDLRVEEVGAASIAEDFNRWLDKDLAKATKLSLPLTLVILLIAFGALVMAGIPVLLGISAVGSALGLWVLVSRLFPDPGMVMHVILLIGLAVGVDYSLFYMRRYREERHQGRDNIDSVRIAAATAGHSVVVSGTAVALAMFGLFLARDAVFASMAAGAILVVLVALVSSMTVLPALLVLLGRWVDRPRVPVLWRLSADRQPRLVPMLVSAVVRRPVTSLLVALVGCGALAFPLHAMSLKATQIEDYPRDLTTMRAYDRLVAAFPDNATGDTVVVQVPERAQLAPALNRVTAEVATRPDLFGAVTDTWTSVDGRTGRVSIAVPHRVDSAAARSSVTALRERLLPAALSSVPGVDYAVSGDIATDRDYTDNLQQKLPIVLGGVLLLTFFVMLFAYRSLAVALITVALNLLSMAAAFGVLVLVFQHSWAEGLLGFTSTGHVVSWVPMLLFVILTGLSLDYHVFVVSRIRENVANGMTLGHAVLDGVTRTAGVVTSAAAVMVGVFATFGALTFLELKQIGVGLAVGILLDATVIRLIALPAMLMVCRRWLWSGTSRRQLKVIPRSVAGQSESPFSKSTTTATQETAGSPS
jgi:RND superfamily putative drug exporter